MALRRNLNRVLFLLSFHPYLSFMQFLRIQWDVLRQRSMYKVHRNKYLSSFRSLTFAITFQKIRWLQCPQAEIYATLVQHYISEPVRNAVFLLREICTLSSNASDMHQWNKGSFFSRWAPFGLSSFLMHDINLKKIITEIINEFV